MDRAAAIATASAALQESANVKAALVAEHLEKIVEIADVVARSIAAGGKLLLCGNGGSAADAQHLAAELLVRLRPKVNRSALPALALVTDPSAITACGNDYSFEHYFARMVEGLGVKGDVLLGITTSGKSANIIQAFEAAKQKGIACVGFLGAGGGPALAHCDYAVVVPSAITARIQEAHITIGHVVMELVEDELLRVGRIRLRSE